MTSAGIAASTQIGELTINGDGTANSDGKVFSGEKLTQLYDAILGVKGLGSLGKLEEATKGTYTLSGNGGTHEVPNYISAQQIREKHGKNIVVTFGGIQWEVTYVTRDNDGNVIVDLWRAQNTTLSRYSGGTGTMYGYNAPAAKLATVYGTSYIRTVSLNMGGLYYTVSGTGTKTATDATATQSESHEYAKFTMPSTSGALTDFIVKPSGVKYQEIENWPRSEERRVGKECRRVC